MRKYIYAITINSKGEVSNKDKYTVVYENKTYCYCKVPGTDELKQIKQERIDSTYTYSSVQYISNDDGINEKIAAWRSMENERTLRHLESNVQYQKARYEKSQKEYEDAKEAIYGKGRV